MSYLISMFIDNELELDEKIEFLKGVHGDHRMYEESMELLEQEKMLQADMIPDMAPDIPPVQFKAKERRRWFPFSMPTIRPFAALTSAGAMAMVILLLLLNLNTTASEAIPYRFVIYKPNVNDVEISGSFTEWEVLPLTKVGATGYWEIELDVPKGEHRYSFILEKELRIADPTVFAKESDDFGGENSILYMSV